MTHPTKQLCPMKGRHMTTMHRDACPVCNPKEPSCTTPQAIDTTRNTGQATTTTEVLTSNERVSDDALRQQLTYWRARGERDNMGAQLSALLFELQERRNDSASVRDRGSDSVPAVGGAHRLDSLARARFVTSEPHLSGYRLTLGFETLAEVSAAHQAIADIQRGAVETSAKPIGAQRYVLRVGHSDDAGLGSEGWVVRMSDHFSSCESAQKWVKAEDYEALRQRFERACGRVTELESAGEPPAPVYRKWPGEPPHCMSCDCGMTDEQKAEAAKTVPFADYKDTHDALMKIKYECVSLADAQVIAGEGLSHKQSVENGSGDSPTP